MCDHCGCRAFPPIAELTAEHEDILRRAWVLAEATRAGLIPPTADVVELVRMLEVHARKEETGLYRELVDLGALGAEQLAELEEEHRELHDALTAPVFDRRAFYALAAHIEVEEMELFPAAMLGFDDEEWAAMQAAHHRAGAGVVT
jgi:hemerythrin-like domain-containing protein